MRRLRPCARGLLAAAIVPLATLAIWPAPAHAQIFSRESEISGLRLGQKVLVDDGSCPAGQIKQVTGMKLAASGVLRSSQCVDRKSARR